MTQVTTCSFFRVDTFATQLWAFTQMQFGIGALSKVPGLLFSKLMGSGGKNGFSAIPNFGVYVLLCTWDSEQSALNFFEQNSFFNQYKSKSKEQFNVFLHFAESHGFWDGKQPFEKSTTLQSDKPIVVLTRATIRTHKLFSFWRRVSKVSHSLDDYSGLIFSIGVGEWPLIQQATISIWRSQREMMDFAYKNPKHKEVVKLTKKLDWYSEEMFARFVPYKLEGNWNGQSVQQLSPF